MASPNFRRARAPIAAIVLALLPLAAQAQEAALTPAVTFPAKGRITMRQQFHYMRHTGNGVDTSQLRLNTSVTLGIDRDTSLALRLPVVHREDLRENTDAADATGLDNLSLSIKRRLWQVNNGNYGSTRLGVFGGVHLPTGTDGLGADSPAPFAGLAFMTIRGRHGFNASATYHLTTSGDDIPILPGESNADLLQFEAAYLFRLAPETYSSETEGAWYALLEADLNLETNGDRDLVLTPGILYEAKRWAFELAVHLPAIADLDDRPELDHGVVVGWRYLF